MASKAKTATLTVKGQTFHYFPLSQVSQFGDLTKLPKSIKVLLENMLRNFDGEDVTQEDIESVVKSTSVKANEKEIAFYPARVLMQDFTGVPGVVDLAAMRDAMAALGGNVEKINPLSPVDLVIDHSVMVDHFGTSSAFDENVKLEMERNQERYEFLKWGQGALQNFRVVPPGTGICHQVNLEYLAQTVWTKTENGQTYAYPDTLVGTDSHTTMVNGMAVLGWGVGGIEAEAAMLGQPLPMLLPEVVGFRLTGKLKEGVTATDLVLTVTQMLRKKGVVGKFVEFFGEGLDSMSLADRATIANMAPEYGATCGFFPIDEETIRYLRFTGRDEVRVQLVEAYAKEQGLWRVKGEADPVCADVLELDLGSVEASMAGPKRPQDRVALSGVQAGFAKTLAEEAQRTAPKSAPVAGQKYDLKDGHVVIAAITSCTNTSNPSVMVGAGILAKKAVALGLEVSPWVKTSLAPGSQVVTEYLNAAGLTEPLNKLGFNLVGYGCTTCIGNSGPLSQEIVDAVDKNGLVVSAVLSGNRNFEGRISPQVRANYLASPPLVVAYAIAGSTTIDLTTQPLGHNKEGKAIYLKDVWPTHQEVTEALAKYLTPEMFKSRYSDVFLGPKEWQSIKVAGGQRYSWANNSTYIKKPSYFEGMKMSLNTVEDIEGARVLAVLGDSITTDHISPAGSIKSDSPAGKWLKDHGVQPVDFNSYGSRRGNHEVMVRGTFANIRLRNEMVPGGKQGGFTTLQPSGAETTIYDASHEYIQSKIPLVVVAGKEYGTGSSRDWAAKGTYLLGVRAVIAESFERIHRSNLVGMGVIPFEFMPGEDRKTHSLDGTEKFSIKGLAQNLKPKSVLDIEVTRKDGSKFTMKAKMRVDTAKEVEYIRNGGILQTVVRKLAQS